MGFESSALVRSFLNRRSQSRSIPWGRWECRWNVSSEWARGDQSCGCLSKARTFSTSMCFWRSTLGRPAWWFRSSFQTATDQTGSQQRDIHSIRNYETVDRDLECKRVSDYLDCLNPIPSHQSHQKSSRQELFLWSNLVLCLSTLSVLWGVLTSDWLIVGLNFRFCSYSRSF